MQPPAHHSAHPQTFDQKQSQKTLFLPQILQILLIPGILISGSNFVKYFLIYHVNNEILTPYIEISAIKTDILLHLVSFYMLMMTTGAGNVK